MTPSLHTKKGPCGTLFVSSDKSGGEGEMTHSSLMAAMSLRASPLRGSVPVAAQLVELEFSS